MERLRSKNIMSDEKEQVSTTTRHLCECYVTWAGEFKTEVKRLEEEAFLELFPTHKSWHALFDEEPQTRYTEMERVIGVMNTPNFTADYDDLHFYLGQMVSAFEMALEYIRRVEDWLLCNGEAIEVAKYENLKKEIGEAWVMIEDCTSVG